MRNINPAMPVKLVRNAPVLNARSLCKCSHANPIMPDKKNMANSTSGTQIFLIVIFTSKSSGCAGNNAEIIYNHASKIIKMCSF
jgi:hypothetical protein